MPIETPRMHPSTDDRIAARKHVRYAQAALSQLLFVDGRSTLGVMSYDDRQVLRQAVERLNALARRPASTRSSGSTSAGELIR